MENNKKRTGFKWAASLNINLLDYQGFPSQDSYNKDLISKEEFLIMAANCSIKKPENASRRDAKMLMKKLL